jgi:hypothetical protein
MKTLYILLLLVVIVITVLIFQKITETKEGFFANSRRLTLPRITTCPHTMNSYTDSKGEILCCEGKVTDNICEGQTVCTMTPSSSSQYDSCQTYIEDYFIKQATQFCPPSLPRFWENSKSSGCASETLADATGPGQNASMCRVYSPLSKENDTKADSCVNRKLLDSFKSSSFCSQAKCNASIISGENQPATIGATYKNAQGITSFCESAESAIRNANSTLSGNQREERLVAINNGTEPNICGYISPSSCNRKAYSVVLTGSGVIQLSQLVVKDLNGINIAKGSKVTSSAIYSPQAVASNAIDGTENIRPYPYIYHSKDEKNTYIGIELQSPACISQIILYWRSECCPERHANKTINIYDANQAILWTSPPTTKDLVQIFTIPTSVFA